MIADYKSDFLELAISTKALQFGTFELKSGRISPYFFNAAKLCQSGANLGHLGEIYAEALIASGVQVDFLFGPAYKGIPLVSAAAIALSRKGHDLPFAFNRKIVKAYGEGGTIIGAVPHGRILVVDDVITAGTAIKSSMDLMQNYDAKIVAALVAVDRQEVSSSDTKVSAIQELEQTYGIQVISIVKFDEILQIVKSKPEFKVHADSMEIYRKKYGSVVSAKMQ